MSGWSWDSRAYWYNNDGKKNKQDEQWQRVEANDVKMVDVSEPRVFDHRSDSVEVPNKVARTESSQAASSSQAPASSTTPEDIDPGTGISFKNTDKMFELRPEELEEQSRRVAQELGLPLDMVDKAQKEVQNMLQKPTKGRTTPCCNCYETKYKSELLPIHPLHHTWQGQEWFICFNCVQCKPREDGTLRNQPLPWSRADYKGNEIRFNITKTDEGSSNATGNQSQGAEDLSGTARDPNVTTDELTKQMQWLEITPCTQHRIKSHQTARTCIGGTKKKGGIGCRCSTGPTRSA